MLRLEKSCSLWHLIYRGRRNGLFHQVILSKIFLCLWAHYLLWLGWANISWFSLPQRSAKDLLLSSTSWRRTIWNKSSDCVKKKKKKDKKERVFHPSQLFAVVFSWSNLDNFFFSHIFIELVSIVPSSVVSAPLCYSCCMIIFLCATVAPVPNLHPFFLLFKVSCGAQTLILFSCAHGCL